MENIYGVDVFIAAVVLVSAVLSFSRGFISEMLGIGSWLIATIVGFYAMPYLEPFATQYLPKPLLANIASLVVVTIVTLVVLTLICSKIEKKVRQSVLNRLDHFLGFIFGAVRGVVILVLIYFLLMTLMPKYLARQQKESLLFPYLGRMTENVKEHLPESLFDNPAEKEGKQKPDEIEELIEKLNAPAKKTVKKSKNKKREASAVQEEKPVDPEKKEKDLFDSLNNPQVGERKKKQTQGYDKREREELDRLFLESMDETDSVVE